MLLWPNLTPHYETRHRNGAGEEVGGGRESGSSNIAIINNESGGGGGGINPYRCYAHQIGF